MLTDETEVFVSSLGDAGKMLFCVAGLIGLVGLLFLLEAKLPFLGRLPGDVHVESFGLGVHFPLPTSLLVSLALTVLINVVIHLFK